MTTTDRHVRMSAGVIVVLLGLALFGLLAASGCASDLDDAEEMASDATVAQVWFSTWGHALGRPPVVLLDDANDPRCPPGAYWIDDTLKCGYGSYEGAATWKPAAERTVTLSAACPQCLAHELTHAMTDRFGAHDSMYHTEEFMRQSCRALVRHRAITGLDYRSPDCTQMTLDAIAKEEGVK